MKKTFISLFVFLSLVCPSPVMAELVSSLKVEAEDGLSIQVINSSNCSPSNMSLNTESKFGAYSGTGGMISPESGGEVYLPLVIDYNGASYGSMTLDFLIRCGNNDNDRTYINFYQECEGNESPDLRISSLGSYYNKYYKKVEYKKVYDGYWYQQYQTHTVNRSFTEGSYLIGLYARNWAIYDYVEIRTSAAIIQNGDAEPSCTAPDHVDISGEWGRFGGETISLTATAYSSAGSGSPIADANITGWQWQKLLGSTWTNVTGANVTGATSANLQISNCDKNNSGKYRCVVSTGATCSTASATATDGSQGFQVRVYTLECYTDGSTDYNFTRVGVANRGTVEVTLSASTTYQFKIHGDDYFGNNGTINEDVTDWDFETGKNNVQVASGLGGTFTFTIDYSANGAVPDISVTYPRKTIYLKPNDNWKQDNAKFAIYYYRKEGETTYGTGWTDFLSASACDGAVYPATIPQWNGVKMIGVRFNLTKTSTGKWDDKWNQTDDLTLTSNDLVTITGWDNSQTYNSSYDAPEYTITFAGNGSTSGSMTNVEGIECEGDVTLEENGYVKTGYSFTGWKDGSSNNYADKATISDIKANIELTAQWSAETYNITLDKGDHGAADQTATVVYNTEELATFTTVAANKGYTLDGYYDGSTKVLNADGSFAGSAVTGYITSSKWTKAADCTLTAKWTAKTTSITLDKNGGDSNGSATATYDSNTLTSFSEADGDGYSCTGYWDATSGGNKIINSDGTLVASKDGYTDASGNWINDNDEVTLYAQWSQTFAVTINRSNTSYGTVTGAGSYASGATVDIKATPETGYLFYGWEVVSGDVTLADASSSSTSFIMPASAVILLAKFTVDPCTSNEISIECEDYVDYTTKPSGSKDSYPTGLSVQTNSEYGTPAGGSYARGNGTGGEMWMPVTLPAGTFSFTVRCGHASSMWFNLYNASTGTKLRYYQLVSSWDANLGNHTTSAYELEAGDYVIGLYGDNGYSAFDQLTITANSAVFCQYQITSLPWTGSKDLADGIIVTATPLTSALSHVVFTYTGSGTVQYYDNTDRSTSLGTITSGSHIALTDALRSNGIYLLCTSGSATLKKAEEVITVTGSTELSSTSVSHLIIHQGGEVTNTADITITGSITYHRPATTLDRWFTFAVPFTLSEIEVYDETDKAWFDVNAVYYTTNNADQSDNNPTGLGHFYLKYLKNDGVNQMTNDRWMYIDPAHSLACVSEWEENDGTRYGYPKKDEAYIILFDSKGPGSDLVGYWASNPKVRFIGGPQTVSSTLVEPEVYEEDDKGYGLYANNTLRSVTLTNDAYIMSEDGTRFDLEDKPTIKPFECYIQATEAFKKVVASIPMRRQGGDTPTAIEDIELNDTSRTIKVLHQGHLIIIRNGQSYNLMGARVH